MFTGIVETLGTFEGRVGDLFTFVWPSHEDDFEIGESIAVNGCCLTLIASHGDKWKANVINETLTRTSLSDLKPGDPVNLERPMKVSDRFGGHIVQGHVDTVGLIYQQSPDLIVRFDSAYAKYAVVKGSIAIDGVSLTLVDVGDDRISVSLIPHTCEVTTLGSRQVGDKVNLEFDIVAKYVERMQYFNTSN